MKRQRSSGDRFEGDVLRQEQDSARPGGRAAVRHRGSDSCGGPLTGARKYPVRPWLQVLALLGVIIAFGVSLALLRQVIGITSPWLALLLMFDFLGIARFAEPLFRLRMPGALRPLRAWERRSDVYRRLRVPTFGRLLRKTPLRYLNTGVYLDREPRDPFRVRLHAESSEANHFWAAVPFMAYIVFAGVNGRWGIAALFLLVQVLLNVYPILHLRYIRGRLDRVIRRMGEAQPSGARAMIPGGTS